MISFCFLFCSPLPWIWNPINNSSSFSSLPNYIWFLTLDNIHADILDELQSFKFRFEQSRLYLLSLNVCERAITTKKKCHRYFMKFMYVNRTHLVSTRHNFFAWIACNCKNSNTWSLWLKKKYRLHHAENVCPVSNFKLKFTIKSTKLATKLTSLWEKHCFVFLFSEAFLSFAIKMRTTLARFSRKKTRNYETNSENLVFDCLLSMVWLVLLSLCSLLPFVRNHRFRLGFE